MPVFEVESVVSEAGPKVILRFRNHVAVLEPLDARRLALALVEASAAARIESRLAVFLHQELQIEMGVADRVVVRFRDYRGAEMGAAEVDYDA